MHLGCLGPYIPLVCVHKAGLREHSKHPAASRDTYKFGVLHLPLSPFKMLLLLLLLHVFIQSYLQ